MRLKQQLKDALPYLKDDHTKENFGKNSRYRHSAVLVVFQLDRTGQEYELLMIRRSLSPLDPHKGQLAFPGGVLETQDKKNPVATALREAHEEIALEDHKVEILCTMPQFSTRFGVAIVPVLGISEQNMLGSLQKNDAEVAEILSIKWRDIKKGEMQHQRYGSQGWQSMKAYTCDAGFIWGASAKIISHLLDHLPK